MSIKSWRAKKDFMDVCVLGGGMSLHIHMLVHVRMKYAYTYVYVILHIMDVDNYIHIT